MPRETIEHVQKLQLYNFRHFQNFKLHQLPSYVSSAMHYKRDHHHHHQCKAVVAIAYTLEVHRSD